MGRLRLLIWHSLSHMSFVFVHLLVQHLVVTVFVHLGICFLVIVHGDVEQVVEEHKVVFFLLQALV